MVTGNPFEDLTLFVRLRADLADNCLSSESPKTEDEHIEVEEGENDSEHRTSLKTCRRQLLSPRGVKTSFELMSHLRWVKTTERRTFPMGFRLSPPINLLPADIPDGLDSRSRAIWEEHRRRVIRRFEEWLTLIDGICSTDISSIQRSLLEERQVHLLRRLCEYTGIAFGAHDPPSVAHGLGRGHDPGDNGFIFLTKTEGMRDIPYVGLVGVGMNLDELRKQLPRGEDTEWLLREMDRFMDETPRPSDNTSESHPREPPSSPSPSPSSEIGGSSCLLL